MTIEQLVNELNEMVEKGIRKPTDEVLVFTKLKHYAHEIEDIDLCEEGVLLNLKLEE